MKQFGQFLEVVQRVYLGFKKVRNRYWLYGRVSVIKMQAERGAAESQAILGVLYTKGIGVAKNNIEALKWYNKAADQGNTSAQLIVGVRYAEGIGVVQDYEEALRWYHEAAKQNNSKAQIAIGLMYANGTGVEKDRDRACEWFILALTGVSTKDWGGNKITTSINYPCRLTET